MELEMQKEGFLAICKGLRSHWPRAQRRGSAVAQLLGLWVAIPLATRMSDSCECCVLSGRVIWVGVITGPEEFYRVWFV